MKKLLFTLLGLGLAIGGTVFAATFNSAQVGSSPQNGYYLQTNGTVSTWAAVSATGGSGTISTSTVPTIGQIPYWTSNGYPSLLGSVATTTVSCSGNASCTPFTVIGSSPITILATGGGGGGSGTISTSSPITAGLLVQSTGVSTIANIATSSLNLTTSSFLSNNISQWNNNSGYLTSLSGAASSTLLTDNNTFTGVNKFTNASSDFSGTWQTHAPAYFQVAGSYLTSVTATAPIFSSGGLTPNITWAGLATTSQPSSSNLLESNGGAGVFGVSTSTLSASSPLTGSFTQIGSGGTIGIQVANTSQGGYLTNTDWNTFNGKQANLGYTPLNQANYFSTTTQNTITTLPSLSLPLSQVTGMFAYPFPSNATSTAITFSGGATINSGLTLGTALTVANGGTGASTLTGFLTAKLLISIIFSFFKEPNIG